MDGAEEVVPRILVEHGCELVLTIADPVDFHAELDRQPLPLRLDDRVDVRLKVVEAALALIGERPQRPRGGEVVDVLGEADLVHPTLDRDLDEAFDPSTE